MLKAHCICFLVLGFALVFVKNSYQEMIWHMPGTLPLDDPFEDLMTSSSERRPFLMFASSQKPTDDPPTSNSKSTFVDKIQPDHPQVKPTSREKTFEKPKQAQPQQKNFQPPNKTQPRNYMIDPRPLHSPTQYIKVRPQQSAFRDDNHHIIRFVPSARMEPQFPKNVQPSTTESMTHSLRKIHSPVRYTPVSVSNDRVQHNPQRHFQFSGHLDSHQHLQADENQNSAASSNQNGGQEISHEHIITVSPEFESLGPRYEHERANEDGRKFLIFHATPIATGREVASRSFNTPQRTAQDRRMNHYHPNPSSHVKLQPAFKQNSQDSRSPVQTLLVHKAEAPSIVIDLVPLHDTVNMRSDIENHRPSSIQYQDSPSITAKDPHQISASSRDSIQNLHEKPVHQLALLHQVQNAKNFDTVTEKYSTLQDLPYLEPEIVTFATPPATTRRTPVASPIIVIPPPKPVTVSKKRTVTKKKTTTKKSKISFSLSSLSTTDSSDQNVPGRPGADYPIFSEIIFTNFDCREYEKPGFYADLEAGCQIFHNCDTTMKKHSFLCPNGTIFHQELFICDWWYNVSCDDSPYFYNLNAGLYVGPLSDKQNPDKKKRNL